MFFTESGLVFINKTPGESANYYYKKSKLIIDSLNKSTNIQIEKLFNTTMKQTSDIKLGCKYF